jgi:hypothetical protein
MMDEFPPAVLETVFRPCQYELERLGFTEREPGIYTVVTKPGFLGALGLNNAPHKGFVDVNPVIGIRSQRVEQLVAELRGRSYSQYHPPTVAMNIGYIMPDNSFKAWRFTGGSASTTTARAMVDTIGEYGLPYMLEHSDLHKIYDLMVVERRGVPTMTVYRIPVVCLLLGEPELARKHLDNRLSRIGTRRNPGDVQYLTFAAQLEERLRQTDQSEASAASRYRRRRGHR